MSPARSEQDHERAPAKLRFAPNWGHFLYSILIGLIAAFILAAIFDEDADTFGHVATARLVFAGDADWPPNFLFYWVLGTVAEIAGDTDFVETAHILLAIAVAAKAYITLQIMASLAPRSTLFGRTGTTTLLVFAFPIPFTLLLGISLHFYLGSIPLNVWHNATTIFLMPIASLTFLIQARDLDADQPKHTLLITFLIVIGILIKPSYFFAYAPAMVLLLLLHSFLNYSCRLILGLFLR